MNQRVLVVEDEAAIAQGLCDCLEFNQYEVEWQADGKSGLAAALHGQFDLLLLDVMLPHVNGFDICKQVREQKPEQAIVMLTAKGSEADILEGFNRGADDYITKPFSVAQLLARMQALIRRAKESNDAEVISVSEDFTIGAIQVHVESLQIVHADKTQDINRRDLELLQLLSEEPGRIISRRRILRDVFGYADPDNVETRSVDMHIVKLRKKLAKIIDGGGIETVRGEGYRWVA